MRERILSEIEAERAAQDEKWGGPEHDDQHGSYDWVAYIVHHLGNAVCWPWDGVVFRRQMVKVAALAVAAIEWVDRGQARHVPDTVDPLSGEGEMDAGSQ